MGFHRPPFVIYRRMEKQLKNAPAPPNNDNDLARMCLTYDKILGQLQDFGPFEASQILCNVINEHIKKLGTTIHEHNSIAAAAEKSMEALADGLRKLRLQAQTVVDNNHKSVVRMSKDDRDPIYEGEG